MELARKSRIAAPFAVFVCLAISADNIDSLPTPAQRLFPPGFNPGSFASIASVLAGTKFAPMPLGSASAIFREATTFNPGGSQANAVATGDLNRDGEPDVVVADGCSDANCTNGAVSVLLVDDEGSLQSPVIYSSGGTNATSVGIRDVNGDGKLDIIVANKDLGKASGSVGVLLGNGNGTFRAAVTYSSGGGQATSVVIGDVNGDGKPDLLVANECALGEFPFCSGGTVGVLLGNGDGTFRPPLSFRSGGVRAQSLAIGDLNGDGKLDFVVGNSDNAKVFLGKGDGSFQSLPQTYAGGFVAVADVNRDERLDLLIVNQSGNSTSPNGEVSVLLGHGDGAFSPTHSYAAPVTGPILAVDLDRGGKFDLVVGSACSVCGNSGVAVFVGNGNGTFEPARIYASGGYSKVSMAVADINDDDKPDIVVTSLCASGSDCSESTLGVLLGTGGERFRGALPYGVGGLEFADSAAVADVNGDGKLDLVFADLFGPTGASGGAIVFLGNGNGTFQPGQTYGSGGFAANSVVVADVNHDQKPDLVLANLCSSANQCSSGQVAVLLGKGDGTFQPVQTYASGGSGASSIAVADLNGDGKLDIVVANENSNTFGVLLGNGNGTFQPATSYSSGGHAPVSVAVADVNGDSKPDVLLANFCSDSTCQSTGMISVLLGDGKGGFSTLRSFSSGGNRTGPLAIGDFNGDGKLDIVVDSVCAPGPCVQNASNGAVGVLLGKGDGGFQPALTTPVPASSNGIGWQLTVADFNGDGKLDLVSGLPGILLLGNGNGTFQTPLNLGAWGAGSAVGDFNQDGKPDLAVGGGNVVVLLNRHTRPRITDNVFPSPNNNAQVE